MTHFNSKDLGDLLQPFELPCGVVLKNRIVKSAMSDSLGDGCGNPTDAQIPLYERWADDGVTASIFGEVQATPAIPGQLPNSLKTDVFRSSAK